MPGPFSSSYQVCTKNQSLVCCQPGCRRLGGPKPLQPVQRLRHVTVTISVEDAFSCASPACPSTRIGCLRVMPSRLTMQRLWPFTRSSGCSPSMNDLQAIYSLQLFGCARSNYSPAHRTKLCAADRPRDRRCRPFTAWELPVVDYPQSARSGRSTSLGSGDSGRSFAGARRRAPQCR